MAIATKQNSINLPRFLDPGSLLASVPVTPGMVVADFGCGNGYYSVAAGSLIGSQGEVHAIDIMEDALSQTGSLAKLLRLRNINLHQCDLEKSGASELAATSCDLVILASLLHQVPKKENVIREAYRVLKTGGKILVVEWKPEAKLGPALADRIADSEARSLLERQGFRPISNLPAGAYHYALLYGK